MTHLEILYAMGNLATDREAEAMAEILKRRGITDLDEVSDEEWFTELIPLAVANANQLFITNKEVE